MAIIVEHSHSTHLRCVQCCCTSLVGSEPKAGFGVGEANCNEHFYELRYILRLLGNCIDLFDINFRYLDPPTRPEVVNLEIDTRDRC